MLLRLLVAGLVAIAASAAAQTDSAPPRGIDAVVADAAAPVANGGTFSRTVWVETTTDTVVVAAEDTQRSVVRVGNPQTQGDALCVNTGFPQDSNAIVRLRPSDYWTWYGQSARKSILCSSVQGVRLDVVETVVVVSESPDADEDGNVYAVDPTPDPGPTPTPDAIQSGGDFSPSNPVYNSTPTPTPYLEASLDTYSGTLTDQATPTPTPTPVAIVVD